MDGFETFPLLDLIEEFVSPGTLAFEFEDLRLGSFDIPRNVLR